MYKINRKYLFLMFIFLIYSSLYSQNETIYLLTNKGGFAINSEDKRFLTDYFIFTFKKGKDSKKNDFKYYTLDKKKEISIDTIKYKTIKEFTENKKPWEIHNELSLMRNVFFIKKTKSDKPNFEYKYYVIPVIYEGTRKNIIPTDLSIHK